MRKVLMLVFVMSVLLGTTAMAQVRSVEIVPFGGYRWSGGISSIPGVSDFEVKDAPAYGVALDCNLPKNSAVELYWSHWSGDWEARLTGGGALRSGSFSRDDIMIGGVWYATPVGAPIRPYFTAGAGVGVFYADNIETIGRFVWSIGAGARKDVNDKLGLRVDFRWPPVWVPTGSSWWCDPYYWYGGCYPVSTGEFFDQWELTGGLIIKLGGRG